VTTPDVVTVKLGGDSYAGWYEVEITAAVNHAARSFRIEAALDASLAAFVPFAPLQIFGNSDLMFTGYIDEVEPMLEGKTAKVSISGRAKGQDIVDCSADHTKPDYVNKTPLDIAMDQDQFGIGFTADFVLDQIDRTRPNPGESAFSFLSDLCDEQDATMHGLPDGSIRMTQAGANPPRQAGALIEGVNIEKIQVHIGSSGKDKHGHHHPHHARHSHVHVHGQRYRDNGAQATQIYATAQDSTVPRYRPHHHLHSRHTTRGHVQKKAQHKREAEAGNGLRATVTVPSWRDETGALFMPGNKVFVDSPTVRLVQDMLIEEISYKQSGEESQGESCVLHLVDPRAHGGTASPGVNKSGSQWGMDTSMVQ
jgi:prophage tail gpP-like protein